MAKKYIDVDKVKAEIERRKELLGNGTGHPEVMKRVEGVIKAYDSILAFIDSIPEQPMEGLEEAADEYASDSTGFIDMTAYNAFIAGAEWQKEQDQPITGNSLEQEWLRYVDKKKKECRGELPSLGEYGWLQIARHFAEWGAEHLKK